MKKRLITTLFNTLVVLLLSAAALHAQTIVTGKVTDADTKEPLIGANIVVKGTVSGTITGVDGSFRLSTTTPLPFTIAVSVVGYEVKEVEVTQNNQEVNFDLSSSTIFGQEVVVSASRVEENILQSPVSVEKMDILAIRQTAAPSFYDALANMKGVEMSTQSLTFRSVNTRGFNANGNTRVVQMIDGMDNQAPGLNFSVGNIAGISELDLEGVELLPGAASALYGPNAINGILLMNSKSPFLYQGLSANVKTGVMNEAGRTEASTPFYDVAVRYAKAINDKFAFKVNFSYLSADDWQANDLRDQSRLNGSAIGNTGHAGNPGYNGVNTYGDETNVNLFTSLFANGQPGTGAGGTSPFLGLIATTQIPQAGNATLPQITGQTPQQLFQAMIPNAFVSRTGYAERDLADYNTYSMKLNGALHYKINDKLEALVQGNYGRGTTVYTGADRYSITDFYLSQIKAELRGSNFYVRAYTTLENSGDAYAVGTYAAGINEAWKPSTTWFPQYFGAYAQGAFQTYATTYLTALGAGQNAQQAAAAAAAATSGAAGNLHGNARTFADQGRLLPGTAQFEQAAAAVRSKPIPGDAQGVGAKFLDKTNLYHAEFMYNFSEVLDPKTLEIVVGANYRVYDLNSEGTLFATDDNGEEFNINEFGGYVQVQKKLFEDRLKLSGSIRYDKNENFKGQFSPRASAVLTVAKTHNIRASYQTGFRIPTTQDQYINLLTPQARLLGGLPLFRDRYNMINNPVYTLQSVQAFGASIQAGAPNPALLKQYQFVDFDPERVRSYELGYKSLITNKLMIDAYVYSNEFLNFLGGQVVVQDREGDAVNAPVSLLSATTRNVYSFPVNSTETLRNWGWAVGVDYLLPKGFSLTSNVSFNDIDDEDLPAGFETSFNTPNYRYNLGLSNRNLVKNVSFNVTYRWQDEFVWQSSFVGPVIRGRSESVVPAYGTLDAQVSYKLSKMKSVIKVGGSNILNEQYTQAWGNPTVGSMFYVSLLFDQFLN